jgi:hypothetical protein
VHYTAGRVEVTEKCDARWWSGAKAFVNHEGTRMDTNEGPRSFSARVTLVRGGDAQPARPRTGGPPVPTCNAEGAPRNGMRPIECGGKFSVEMGRVMGRLAGRDSC